MTGGRKLLDVSYMGNGEHVGVNLQRRAHKAGPAYLSLAVGDPWTFIMPAPVISEDKEAPLAVGEFMSNWFATDEPGRHFRVTAIHGRAFETKYIGFEGEQT